MQRLITGVLLTLAGGAGLALIVWLVYGLDAHYRQRFTFGMPGDLLFALASMVVLLGGLGLVFGDRSRAGR